MLANTEDQKVVVIGGNISGLSTTLSLSKKNIPTILYEEKIWAKPCGGGFGFGLTSTLKDLGVNIPFRYVKWLTVANKYKKVDIVVPLTIVSRYKLQESLMNVVKQKSNVTVEIGRKLNFTHDFDKFQNINVVASGINGFSRQALCKSLSDVGMYQYQLIKAESEDLVNFDATIFYMLPKLQGYAWLFPAPEGMLDVGIGGLGKGVNWDRELEKFMLWVKREYGQTIKIAKKSRSWGIPVPMNKPGRIARRYKNKLFVGVGDAIELADSITAAGIEPAWFSGQLLGDSISSATTIDLRKYAVDLEERLRAANMTTVFARVGTKVARNNVMFPLIFSLVPGKLVKFMFSWQQVPPELATSQR